MDTAQPARWSALLALLRPDAGRWAVLGVVVAASTALTLAGPLVVRRVVDRAADGASRRELGVLAVVFLSIAIATQLTGVAVAWYATVAAWRTTNTLRLRMTRHVLGLDHEFHRTHTPGELIQRVDGDVTSVSDFLGVVVPKALGGVLVVIGIVAVLGVLDWRLAAGTAVYLAVTASIVVRSRHRAVTETADEMGVLAKLYGGIEERLTAAEDLRANGASSHVAWRFVEESTAALSSAVRRERAFLTMWWLVQMSVAAGWCLVLVLGAALVSGGFVSIGTAFLLYQYVLLMGRPLEEIVDQLETVQKANGAMVRVVALLDVQPAIRDLGTTIPPRGVPTIEFDDVAFDYGDGRLVLDDVTATIVAGHSVGIVGRTGSGKTTLSRLVLRLVEPTRGQVRLAGVPLADIPSAELRRRVALVPQEVELFSGTMRENVTLFDPRPTDSEVIAALERVGLAALAAGGIHRPLGSGGAGLSAGEAQLLALARVWLRNPEVIVLDEATARIDPGTEARLEAAVAALRDGRTTLIIAHRLTTLRTVDDIMVFDHGRLVEFGRRADLVGDDDSRFAGLLALAGDDDLADDAMAVAR